ncbi:hypothetical protein BS78_06G150300 [Paspalum vaginatum]|nr:hypothetical protein BS78_06G150300 [Paspalum vaginatum]
MVRAAGETPRRRLWTCDYPTSPCDAAHTHAKRPLLRRPEPEGVFRRAGGFLRRRPHSARTGGGARAVLLLPDGERLARDEGGRLEIDYNRDREGVLFVEAGRARCRRRRVRRLRAHHPVAQAPHPDRRVHRRHLGLPTPGGWCSSPVCPHIQVAVPRPLFHYKRLGGFTTATSRVIDFKKMTYFKHGGVPLGVGMQHQYSILRMAYSLWTSWTSKFLGCSSWTGFSSGISHYTLTSFQHVVCPSHVLHAPDPHFQINFICCHYRNFQGNSLRPWPAALTAPEGASHFSTYAVLGQVCIHIHP